MSYAAVSVPSAQKETVKNYANKKLGVSFSRSSILSFSADTTVDTLRVTMYEPAVEAYIRKNAHPLLLSIFKKGYTQDRSGTLMVFKKPFASVLKKYKGSDLTASGLVKKAYGKNMWQKKSGDYPEYYLEKKGKTYIFEVSDAISEKELSMVLKTFSAK